LDTPPPPRTQSSAERRRLSDQEADIVFNLREMDRSVKQRPSPPDYLKTAQGFRMDEQTRVTLVSWMDDFTRCFGLAPGTPRRAASYVDRVLSARTLPTPPSSYELGLLGAAAVFTAAKYEEGSTISRLNAADIARYCGFATSKEVVDMEREMLAALRYELGGTLVDHFTGDSRGEQDLEIQNLAHQLAGDSEVLEGYLQFMPSAVAASAVFFAICIVFALFSEYISMENLVLVL
jgi:cyclin A